MKETINTNAIFNEAAKGGAILGLVSIAYMFLTEFLSTAVEGKAMATFAVSALTLVLWAGKLYLCLYLMKTLMEKLVQKYDGVTNSNTYHFGMLVAFFSALLYSACSLANVLLISPDTYSSQVSELMAQYSTMLDSNTMSAMEDVSQNFGSITFFSNLIYCFIFGWIVSAIYSRRIPKKDEFAGFEKKEDSADNQ